MKKLTVALTISCALLSQSCKKCADCTETTSSTVWGITSSTSRVYEVCGKEEIAKAESNDSEASVMGVTSKIETTCR